MKKILALAALVLLLVPARAYAESTAKGWLGQGMQLGKKWQPDAVLTSVGTPGADANGKSRLWMYEFYSRKSKGCIRVGIAMEQEPFIHHFPHCSPSKPISTEFVDSTVAIEEAKRNGFKPDDLVSMGLEHSKDWELKPGGEYWSISTHSDYDSAKGVLRAWIVNPKTGKFIKRLSGKK